jgi:hypothetical protein
MGRKDLCGSAVLSVTGSVGFGGYYGPYGYGPAFGNRGDGYGGYGYGGFGRAHPRYVLVYIPGVGWVMVPRQAVLGRGFW